MPENSGPQPLLGGPAGAGGREELGCVSGELVHTHIAHAAQLQVHGSLPLAWPGLE